MGEEQLLGGVQGRLRCLHVVRQAQNLTGAEYRKAKYLNALRISFFVFEEQEAVFITTAVVLEDILPLSRALCSFYGVAVSWQ